MQTAPPCHPLEGPVSKSPSEALSGDCAVLKSLVVSIHDLSTVTRETVARMLEDLAGVCVPVTSLLVIPDHHHRGGVDADPEFGEWIRKQVGEGHEAVLHGFYHLRTAKPGEGIATRLITRSYTAGEGEFHDLSFEEASTLLQLGRQAMRACGIEPEGFIAPAWLLGDEAERAVRSEGFGYTTRIGSVIDCRSGRSFPSRSMVYSVRAPWRRGMSLLWNGALFHALRNTPLLRIGLHPPDWEHEAIRSQILECIRLAAKKRRVTTYREWLDHHRSPVHEKGLS